MTGRQVVTLVIVAVVVLIACVSQFAIGLADGGVRAGLKRVALVFAVAYGAIVITVAVGGPFWMAAQA